MTLARAGRYTASIAAALACLAALGCSGSGTVVRVVDGRVVLGRFIGEEAYASFLVGALAEESGDLRLAVAAYERAASADSRAPEVWTRVGLTRCRLEPQSKRADLAIAEALRLDAAYEPAKLAQRSCEAFRHDGAAGVDALLRVELLDPTRPEAYRIPATIASTGSAATTDEERHALVALTLRHAERVAAWDALATWGLAHGDLTIALRGMIGVARRVPGRRALLGETATALALSGHEVEARALAAALLDADIDRSSAGEGRAVASMPLVARLAIDQAILDRDAGAVHARAEEAHVGLEVAAGRAWALGNLALARSLAASTAKADPTNLEARLVVEGANGRGASWLLPASSTGAALAPEVAIPLARLLLVAEGLAAARRVLAFGGGTKLLDGDPLLLPLADALVNAGALAEDRLPSAAQVARAGRPKIISAE